MRRHVFTKAVAAVALVASSAPLIVQAGGNAILGQVGPATSGSTSTTAPPASSGPTPEQEAQATEHFMNGVRLTQEKAWDGALAEFEASIALVPKKSNIKNAAICLNELYRYDEALAMWQRLLNEFGPKLTPEDRTLAEAKIAELKGRIGYLVITSNQEGASVTVNGKERGKTPLKEPVLVSIGQSVVRVSKEGFAPFEAKPQVVGKATVNIDARLDPLAQSGRIAVFETGGKTLHVIVDGADLGTTPYAGSIAPGAHVVVLKDTDHVGSRLGTQPAAVNVELNKTASLRLGAELLDADLRIEPEPVGASVTLDGVPLGQGVWEGMLKSGKHIVDVSADGYFGGNKTIEAKAGKNVAHVKLDRDENSPFWSKGRKYPLSLAVVGSGMIGQSLNGDYEANCGTATTTCYARNRPTGFMAALRGGYEFSPGFSFELEFGYAAWKMSVSRQTSLFGEQSNSVPVNVKDDVSVGGPYLGVGVAYAFIRRPIILSGALEAGVIISRTRETRVGTVSVDDFDHTYSLRRLTPTPYNTTPVTAALPFIVPEIRLALPIGDQFQIGIGLGVLVGTPFNVRPSVSQAPDPTVGVGTAKYNGKAIGFVPQPNAVHESAMGLFALPRGSFFARLSF